MIKGFEANAYEMHNVYRVSLVLLCNKNIINLLQNRRVMTSIEMQMMIVKEQQYAKKKLWLA